MKLKDLGEFNLIKRLSKTVKLSPEVLRGIGDDAAVLKYKKDRYLLATCDMLLEGRHFRRHSGAYLIGKKSISASISDIIAMGGLPRFCLVSLGVPGSLDLGFVDELYRGIRSVARNFKIDLVGGDTIRSGKIIINVTLLGEVERQSLVLRSGSRGGDSIFLTGSIGGALGYRHLSFTPRLKESRFLVKNFKVHSMIDVSDGLIADLGHILERSKVGAVIYEREIPISGNATSFKSAVKEGEDFELLFTLSRKEEGLLIKKWPFKTRLSMIGRICDRPRGVFLLKKDGRKEGIKITGYSHF